MHAYIPTYSTEENIPTYYIDTQTFLPCITYIHVTWKHISTHLARYKHNIYTVATLEIVYRGRSTYEVSDRF